MPAHPRIQRETTNDPARDLETYGVLTEPATLTIQRLLPGPIERVWAYLTESDRRRQWLAAGQMEMKVGAPFEFVWRNDALRSASQRPAGFPEEHRMQSRITGWIHRTSSPSPGKAVAMSPSSWSGADDQVLLTVIHRRLPDRDTLLKVAAGWHMHLDILVARASDKEPEPSGPAGAASIRTMTAATRLTASLGHRLRPAWERIGL